MIVRWLIVLALCVTATLVSGKAVNKHGDKSPSDSKSDIKHTKTATSATTAAHGKSGPGNINLQFKTGKAKGGGGGGNCTVNCTITFENDDNNLGDGDPMNLMEEERNDENHRSDAEKSAKRHDKFDSESNGAESEESSGHPDDEEDMVEPDTHTGNENTAAVETKQTSGAIKTPNLDVVAAKEGGKAKEVSVPPTPQSTVQEGSKLPVSDMSNATQHPSMPIPQMIPLPLFYNSGENEGSANGNGMTSDTKKTSEIDEINGESGYGELFTANKTKQAQRATEQHAQVSQSSLLVTGAAGQPMKKKHHRVHLHAGKKVEVGAPNVAPAVVAKVNPAGDAAPGGPNTFAPHVDDALAAAKPGGETTTDYPFVVSDGPKANIHPLRNSKIKMGNDHDEDLVDYYDEDDDSEDAPAVAPLSDEADASEDSDSDSESESESGDSLDNANNADNAPKLAEGSTVRQGAEEASGSGSGEAESSGSDAVEEKTQELEKTKKPKKDKGKKIRTKTFEFGVGELGGNNLPIVVPVISSKRPKENEEKKNDQKAQQVPKKNKDVTENAAVAATTPDAPPNTGPNAAAPGVAANIAAAAKEINLNELTLEEARNLMHEEAKTLLLADQAKVLKEKEQALKKEEEALKAQEEQLRQQAMREAEALKEQKKLMEQKKLQEKALQEEAIKVKKLKDDALKEEEKAKALLKEKKDEEEKEEKEAKLTSKHVKGRKGKKAKNVKVATSAKAEGLSAKASQKGSETEASREEWIIDMKDSPLSPLAKPAAEIQSMTIPGAPAPPPAPNAKPDHPAQFLYDGIGSKIAGELDKLTGKPDVAPAVTAAGGGTQGVAQGVANECMGLCLQSCGPDCPPECCGRSGFPLKNGVTAQILPIPEDLNKVIKDAGLGPGTTAQILPNEQNKHMLQQAGFADGVTARIIPIPAGYNVQGAPAQGTDSLGRSSPAEHAKLTITPPTRAKATPGYKESAQPPHPPPAPMVALASRTAPQPNLNPGKAPQPAQQPLKAVSPPSAQAVQPAHAILPAQQLPPPGRLVQDASARDQGIAAMAAAAKAAKVPLPPLTVPKPPPSPPATPLATITTLAEGERNYDESVYRELLAQLPPSVAPEDNTFVPLTVTQQLHQINVPEQAGKLRKFFKSVKTQDPFSNLEAYKRQEFKNYDEQFLVDDR